MYVNQNIMHTSCPLMWHGKKSPSSFYTFCIYIYLFLLYVMVFSDIFNAAIKKNADL